ncbi:MAG: hypothetical protein ACFCVA_12290 [Gammaproteobacteria bacterium]
MGQPIPWGKGRREDVPVGLDPASLPHAPLRARVSAAQVLGANGVLQNNPEATMTMAGVFLTLMEGVGKLRAWVNP